MSRSLSYREALQSFVAQTSKMKKSLPLQPTPPSIPLPTIPPLQLSQSIQNFKTSLVQNSVHPRITNLVLSKVNDLEDSYQRSYKQACRVLSLPDPSETPIAERLARIKSMYERRFDMEGIARLLRTTMAANSSLRSKASDSTIQKEERRIFNHESTPVLEEYFSRNAYPSQSDRQILACDTNMTPRQIGVWFQNHRTRAKKEGQALKREIKSILSFPTPPPETPDSLQIPLSDVNDAPVVQVSGSQLFASSTAPPHAFPSPYPPQSVGDPFPNVNGRFSFPPPVWPRSQDTTPVRSTVSSDYDVDKLTSDFSEKLSLQCRGNARRVRSISEPWFYATTVVPPVAPLPALVQKRLPSHMHMHKQKPPPFPTRRPCQPRGTTFISWVNTEGPSASGSRASSMSSNSTRTVSMSSTISSQSSTSSRASSPSLSPVTPPSQHPLGKTTGRTETPNTDSNLRSVFFDLETYTSSLPDVIKHYTPSFDHFFLNYSISSLVPT